MSIRSNMFSARPRAAALVLATSLLSIGATSAQAQLFNWDSALSPMRVERMIQASGYRLTRPVIRNGPIYLANVLGREDDPERLVIDARDGRLLQRYAAPAARRLAAVPANLASAPRPRAAPADSWIESEDDFPPPRPPADIDGDSGGDVDVIRGPVAPPVRAPQGGQIARADDASSASPYVILAPPAATHAAPALEKPRPKPQVRRKKPEPTPVASPATAPPAQPAANPQASTNPQAATPGAATPTRSDAAGDPTAAAPRVADTKPVAAAAVPAAQAAIPVPPAKAAQPKPALNDVPAAPLE